MDILKRAKRLAPNHGVLVSEIAQRANISRAHTQHILVALETEGLLVRYRESPRRTRWGWR